MEHTFAKHCEVKVLSEPDQTLNVSVSFILNNQLLSYWWTFGHINSNENSDITSMAIHWKQEVKMDENLEFKTKTTSDSFNILLILSTIYVLTFLYVQLCVGLFLVKRTSYLSWTVSHYSSQFWKSCEPNWLSTKLTIFAWSETRTLQKAICMC